MIKEIHFPVEELEQLKGKTRIITTRVSREYNRYHIKEILKTPWNELYIVAKVDKITDIKEHPFYHNLTKEQIQLISKYKKIDILTLEKV